MAVTVIEQGRGFVVANSFGGQRDAGQGRVARLAYLMAEMLTVGMAAAAICRATR